MLFFRLCRRMKNVSSDLKKKKTKKTVLSFASERFCVPLSKNLKHRMMNAVVRTERSVQLRIYSSTACEKMFFFSFLLFDFNCFENFRLSSWSLCGCVLALLYCYNHIIRHQHSDSHSICQLERWENTPYNLLPLPPPPLPLLLEQFSHAHSYDTHLQASRIEL